ncbi:hypothetical protein SOVF_107940 [Spinacia oleracea]|nr:hypothetical protein SOVF_107940 [Spinacia oleracea]
MVKTCETCGDKGFSRYLTYSTGDTVEHMYSSELPPDELPAKMVMCGDEMTKFSGCHPLRISYLSLPDASAIPVAGPIWRPECKRARSKRGKKARKCNDQEADMFCQIFDKPGQAETCTDEPAVIASSGQENTSLLNDKIGTLENIVEECIPRVAVTIKEPKTVAVDESEKIVEIKTSGQGQALLPSLEVKQETPLEKGSCMTSGLDLERKSSSPSISSTVFMELDDEETTISGSQNCIEASVTTIPASNLEMAGGEYHESSSNRSELESVHLSDLRHHHVNHLRNVLELAEGVGINVKWLWNRCDDLEKLDSHLTQYPILKSNLAQSEKDIQDKEKRLSLKRIMVGKLEDEIKLQEKEFESLKEYTEKLASSMQGFESICGSFHDKFVVDGLL